MCVFVCGVSRCPVSDIVMRCCAEIKIQTGTSEPTRRRDSAEYIHGMYAQGGVDNDGIAPQSKVGRDVHISALCVILIYECRPGLDASPFQPDPTEWGTPHGRSFHVSEL